MEKGECVIATVRRTVPSTRVKETGPAFVVDMVVGIIERRAALGVPPSKADVQRLETRRRQKRRQAPEIASERITHVAPLVG
jgi:hypothetical protein